MQTEGYNMQTAWGYKTQTAGNKTQTAWGVHIMQAVGGIKCKQGGV